MNVTTLINRHPLLRADLQAFGLAPAVVKQIAVHISSQLGSPDGNLCRIMHALSTRDFVRAIDANRVAQQAEIPAAVAQSIVMTLAPWVGRFQLSAN